MFRIDADLNNNLLTGEYEDDAEKQNDTKITDPISLAYKKKVIEYIELHPNQNFKTVRHKFRQLHHKSYIQAWKRHVRQGLD